MRGLAALNTWRANVSTHRLAAALLAGFVATHIATVTGFWYRIVGLENLNWPAFNGLLLLPESSANAQFLSGSIYHYLTGICYGILFAYLIHPVMPGPNSVLGNIGKGLLFAGFLGLLSALLWVPRNFPDLDPGFFSNNLGWKTVVGIFVWHAVYGLHLGALYNPLPVEQEAPYSAGGVQPAR